MTRLRCCTRWGVVTTTAPLGMEGLEAFQPSPGYCVFDPSSGMLRSDSRWWNASDSRLVHYKRGGVAESIDERQGIFQAHHPSREARDYGTCGRDRVGHEGDSAGQ